MHWLTKVQQDIVCHINNVIDWTDTSVHQKVLQPLWTWFNSHIFNHARFVSQDLSDSIATLITSFAALETSLSSFSGK